MISAIPDCFSATIPLANSKWVTFTVTTSDPTFFAQMERLTGSETGRGGLASFINSQWLITVSIFHQPEFVSQSAGVSVWWGFGLFPDRVGNFVGKPMSECSGAEILNSTACGLGGRYR